ncbi:MAG: Uma2 family endonuclease [Janthinobacterium lividum]
MSPSTATHDTHTKFDLYTKNGVSEYWIVLPGEQTVVGVRARK